MLRSCCGESFVGGDQRRPLYQGGCEVKTVVDRLIEVEGYRVGRGDVAARWQQFDRDRLDAERAAPARSRVSPSRRPMIRLISPRRRSASITAVSMLRITICPTRVWYNEIDIYAINLR